MLVRLFIMSPLIHIQQHFDADTNRDDDNHGSDNFLAARQYNCRTQTCAKGLPGKHHQPQRPDHFTAENEEQNRGNVRRQVDKIRVDLRFIDTVPPQQDIAERIKGAGPGTEKTIIKPNTSPADQREEKQGYLLLPFRSLRLGEEIK